MATRKDRVLHRLTEYRILVAALKHYEASLPSLAESDGQVEALIQKYQTRLEVAKAPPRVMGPRNFKKARL